MEQLVDSIRVPCPHAAHGCTDRPVYYNCEGHAQACAHAPCRCPGQGCGFVGSTVALQRHFAAVHSWPCTTEDKAGTGFDINLRDGFNFFTVIRAGANQGTTNQYLFLLNVELASFGRTITVFCIHPHHTSTATLKLTYGCYSSFDMCCMHHQVSEFKVACTDLSNGLPDPSGCFVFIVPRSAHRDDEEEASSSEPRADRRMYQTTSHESGGYGHEIEPWTTATAGGVCGMRSLLQEEDSLLSTLAADASPIVPVVLANVPVLRAAGRRSNNKKKSRRRHHMSRTTMLSLLTGTSRRRRGRHRPHHRSARIVGEMTVECTDALDCGICFLPLKPPIFQCDVGHVLCSPCRDKVAPAGRCHVCRDPTGFRRCHAMEKMVDSVRVPCPHAAHGCADRPAYHDRERHARECVHAPCRCPVGDACGFAGSVSALAEHLTSTHGWPCTAEATAGFPLGVDLRDGFNLLLTAVRGRAQ
ncbi:hypothetical protein BAE44_0018337 [Dichanthelium oligosanthes]|uniref:RING-type E3 ubiquitin transferase n=1 Tax=Dichanthelium oligosanthes TaxID=888268 RepID=A0A1E5V649_9POAL|nr:hypothetical protein BAE44_0018337 [Dichanthelium oligosanthes]